MSAAKTASVLHMSLTLHASHGFTAACATDGASNGVDAGERGHRVAYGVVNHRGDAWGGALVEGATVQDARVRGDIRVRETGVNEPRRKGIGHQRQRGGGG